MLRISALQGEPTEAVFNLLVEALAQRITIGPGHPDFLAKIQDLPIGLKAMAATHHLDVSLTLDDLGWHFGNWHDARLTEATASGLDELGATELANLFRQAYGLALKYWVELGREDWTKWYPGSGLEKEVEPLNERACALLDEKWNGILGIWVEYARQFPDKVGARNDA